MNEHHSSRAITITFIVLIGLMLLIGTLNAFSPVHAAASPSATPTGRVAATGAAGTPTLTPTPVDESATPMIKSADTGGSIGMSVLLVLIILFGVMWSWRKPGMKRERPPKPAKRKKEKAKKK